MASILNQFWQTRMHFKAENLLICEDPWWFTYESQKNNDQICNSGLFLQNTLVEYIGVYSDTKSLHCSAVLSQAKVTDWWHLIVIYLSSWGGCWHLIVLLHLMAPYNRGCLQPLLGNWPFSLSVCICLWSAEKSKFSSYAPRRKITIECHHWLPTYVLFATRHAIF